MYAEDRPDVASDEVDTEREGPCGPVVAVWDTSVRGRTFLTPFPEVLESFILVVFGTYIVFDQPALSLFSDSPLVL